MKQQNGKLMRPNGKLKQNKRNPKLLIMVSGSLLCIGFFMFIIHHHLVSYAFRSISCISVRIRKGRDHWGKFVLFF